MDTELLRNIVLRITQFKVSPNGNNVRILKFFLVAILPAFGSTKICRKSMEMVFAACDPFKIVAAVIVLVSVFMVHLVAVSVVGYKGVSDKTVNKELTPDFFCTINGNYGIPRGCVYGSQYLNPRKVCFTIYKSEGSNGPKRTNFIPSVCPYSHPAFVHAPKMVC